MTSLRPNFTLILIVGLAAMLSSAQGQNTITSSGTEEQVRQLERDWLAADGKGDVASLRQIIADDFIGSNFQGQVLSKHDIVPEHAGPGGFAGATPGDTNVRVFGDTAVLMGVINTVGGPGKQVHVTLVFQKKSESWRMIAAELTRNS